MRQRLRSTLAQINRFHASYLAKKSLANSEAGGCRRRQPHILQGPGKPVVRPAGSPATFAVGSDRTSWGSDVLATF